MKTENIDRRKFIQIGSTGAMVVFVGPSPLLATGYSQ